MRSINTRRSSRQSENTIPKERPLHPWRTAFSPRRMQDEDCNGVREQLSNEDRRLLLGSSLRLLMRRFSTGRPVLQSDVIRVASLADDAVECAA
jgi:hypothetical protein